MKRLKTVERLTPNDQYPGSTKSFEEGLAAARNGLMALQKEDGHWCFPLEADCTIPAEYVLMMHFMDDIDVDLEHRIARFIRQKQDPAHDGWSLYLGGDFDLSCTVKSYYALKIAGDSPEAPHMMRACAAILKHGGGRSRQRIHPLAACDVQPDSLARRSIRAGGNHIATQMVPVSPEQGFILVPNRNRTAVDLVQPESACRKPAKYPYTRAVHGTPPRKSAIIFRRGPVSTGCC